MSPTTTTTTNSFYVCVFPAEGGQYAGGGAVGVVVAYFTGVPTSLYGGSFGATVVYFTGAITSDPWQSGGLCVTLLYVFGVCTRAIL